MNVALVQIAEFSHPDLFQKDGLYTASLFTFENKGLNWCGEEVIVIDLNGTELVPGQIYLAVKKETNETEWKVRGKSVYCTVVENQPLIYPE